MPARMISVMHVRPTSHRRHCRYRFRCSPNFSPRHSLSQESKLAVLGFRLEVGDPRWKIFRRICYQICGRATGGLAVLSSIVFRYR